MINPVRFDSRERLADRIYRPFFIAGIATVLTLGCVWGAINLFTIGLKQNFSAVSYSWVLAHGHAMVFGFVGFFIMGFAYQAFPRFKHTNLWRPRLAILALPLMIAGIVLQTVAHMWSPPSLSTEIVAATIQFAAVIIFGSTILMTARNANKRENYDRFVYAALVWFVLAAIANPIIFKLFELASSRQELLFNLATFNIPYRDVQLLGIAVVMILGVSLRLLPPGYGFREPSRNWQHFTFWGVNVAIGAGAVLFIAGMAGGNHWLLALQWVTTVVLLAVAAGIPFQYRLFGPVPENERDRGLKFIRTAHIWFIVATTMLVFTPVYNFAIYMPITGSHSPFSHAFFGAYRHALTVGFIMMMIVGVSSKVVPTLAGVDVRRAHSLWPTFVLLNLGNVTRVSFQIATDFSPHAYRVMGISGFIEVIALALWGYELVANIREGKRLEKQSSAPRILETLDITPNPKVGDVLAHF
ncbi:MAG TPA: NnrS family protein [Pyrinomonadaceae bacterium]|nr:NnrS family protein [Pyrinomonadaceae bacterium]